MKGYKYNVLFRFWGSLFIFLFPPAVASDFQSVVSLNVDALYVDSAVFVIVFQVVSHLFSSKYPRTEIIRKFVLRIFKNVQTELQVSFLLNLKQHIERFEMKSFLAFFLLISLLIPLAITVRPMSPMEQRTYFPPIDLEYRSTPLRYLARYGQTPPGYAETERAVFIKDPPAGVVAM